jgi:hypothetical protein
MRYVEVLLSKYVLPAANVEQKQRPAELFG